jgi:hypothetical protein
MKAGRGQVVSIAGDAGLGKSHIPSDLVVDGCPQMSRAAQSLISRWDLMYGRQTSHEIRPIISMGCNFTTKSDGIWATQAGFEALHSGLVKHHRCPAGGRDV